MSQISILIPTRNRPGFLKSALRSVAEQSNLSNIREVIVSENSDTTESLAVCELFSSLPIRYVQRQPDLPVGEHFVTLVQEARSTWVAPLGDDDMWGRYHLCEAKRVLEENPTAVAYFGQCVVVADESKEIRRGYGPNLGTKADPTLYLDAVLWDVKRTFIEVLLRTPLNVWSLVGKRENVQVAFSAFTDGEPGFDSDRLMIWRLAKTGPIAVGREVSLFYRVHEGSACQSMLDSLPEFHRRRSYEYSVQMIREAESLGIEPNSLWAACWNSLSTRQQKELLTHYLPGALAAVKEEFGFMEDPPVASIPASSQVRFQQRLRSIAKEILPPVTLRLVRAFRRQSQQIN